MKKVLVSLVSDQTTPNVEFILEINKKADAYLFISTKSMEQNGNRKWILDAAQLDNSSSVETIIVDPHSFEDIEKELSKVIDDDNQYFVNLTGGTKVMSLAVFEFFKTMDAEIYYLTGRGQMIKLHPGRKKTSSELTAKITLKNYLVAHGLSLKQGTLTGTFEQAQRMLDFFLAHPDLSAYEQAFAFFRANRSLKQKKSYQENPVVSKLIDDLGYQPTEVGLLNKYDCKYLSGEWLEEYLYFFIKNNFPVSEENLAAGSEIEKKGTKNELDVLVSTNNNIYIFECKTSIYTPDEKPKQIIGDTIYKSISLRNNMGLFAQTTIITLSDLSDKKLEDHIKRAAESRVGLIGRSDFAEGKLYDRLKKILNL